MKVLLTSDRCLLDAARLWLVVLSLNCDRCCVKCSKTLTGGTVSELWPVLCQMQQDFDWWYCLWTVTGVVSNAARLWLVVLSLNCDRCCVECSKTDWWYCLWTVTGVVFSQVNVPTGAMGAAKLSPTLVFWRNTSTAAPISLMTMTMMLRCMHVSHFGPRWFNSDRDSVKTLAEALLCALFCLTEVFRMLLLKQLQCLRMARSHPLWVDHPGAGQYLDQAWVGAG